MKRVLFGFGAVLPPGYFSVSTALLPLYPYLFSIRAGSH